MKAFQCKTCGDCCYGEGGIFVQEDEVEKIARFLDISTKFFSSEFCRKMNGRVYIKTGPDKFCIFYDKRKQCLIHPVKPSPCTLWPFYPTLMKDEENWQMAKDACPGINPECSFEDFVRQGKE